MSILLSGLLLFFTAHFYAALRSRQPEKDIIRRIGERRYKGLYSLISGIGLILIIWGYSRSEPSAYLYFGFAGNRSLTMSLMLPALILITAADLPKGYLKHWVKHPMLIAVILWSSAHLLDGADLRQLLLFGSFLVFAIFDLVCVSFRPSTVIQTEPHWRNDLLVVVLGVILYIAIAFWLHDWFIGIDIVV